MNDAFWKVISGKDNYLYVPEKLQILSETRKEEIIAKKNNEEKYKIALVEYDQIITKAAKLIREIGIKNNPTSEFMVFTYLLWKGIFSKDMKYVYENVNLLNIKHLYHLDIIDGHGVCKASSELLREVFKTMGYNAYFIVNAIQLHYTDYRVDTNMDNRSKPLKNGKCYEDEELSVTGDHALVLLEKGGNYYMYDPTNIFVFKANKMFSADLYNGLGKCYMKPWGLFVFEQLNLNQILVLLDKIKSQDTSRFLTSKDITNITLETLDYCYKLKSLILDYHEEIKPNINRIIKNK